MVVIVLLFLLLLYHFQRQLKLNIKNSALEFQSSTSAEDYISNNLFVSIVGKMDFFKK